MKKKIIATCLIVFVLISTCCIAYALRISSKKATNIITSNTLSLKLYDEREKGVPFPEDGITNVLPGDKIDKYVYVQNDDKSPEWVRIRLDYDIKPSETTGAVLTFDDIILDINNNKWIKGNDGWYYYTDILMPGEYSDYLFTNVSFSYVLDNNYEDCTVKINVEAQSTQYANNGKTVLDATGWPSEEKGEINYEI